MPSISPSRSLTPRSLTPRVLTPWLALLLAVQLAGAAHTFWFFETQGYLPSPFVYDKSDSFMDFYHPLFWADHDGRYSVWLSVYPPLNFLILKAIGFLFLGGERFADGFAIRAAHPELQIVIVTTALATALIAFRLSPLRQMRAADQILLFLFFVLSPPFLFAIERGNLIVLALPFLALALSRGGWTRMAAIAVLINLKPYFALLTLVYVARRRFDLFILTGLLAALLFLVTGLLLDPDFPLFFVNLLGFSQSETVFSGREVLALPSSISAFAYVAEISLRAGTADRFLGQAAMTALSHLAAINLLTVLFCIAAILIRGQNLPIRLLLAFLTLTIANLGVWVGGYCMSFAVLLVPILATLRYRIFYVAALLLLLSPLDLVILREDVIGLQNVYLSSMAVEITSALGAGSLIRPALDLLMLCLLTWELCHQRQARTVSARHTPRFDTALAI